MNGNDKPRPGDDPNDPRLPEHRDAPTRPQESDKDKTGEGVEDAVVRNLTNLPPG